MRWLIVAAVAVVAFSSGWLANIALTRSIEAAPTDEALVEVIGLPEFQDDVHRAIAELDKVTLADIVLHYVDRVEYATLSGHRLAALALLGDRVVLADAAWVQRNTDQQVAAMLLHEASHIAAHEAGLEECEMLDEIRADTAALLYTEMVHDAQSVIRRAEDFTEPC